MDKVLASGTCTIGSLAQRTGLSVSAIRYYEEVGLLPPALRRPSGHRVYPPHAQELLTLIRRCRDCGFSIEETRALVALSSRPDRGCVEARDIAQVQLETVRAKLAELTRLESTLAAFVATCTDQCAGGPAPQCTIFQDLLRDGSPLAKSRTCCGQARPASGRDNPGP